MKISLLLLAILTASSLAFAGGSTNTNVFSDPEMEKLFQRYLKELRDDVANTSTDTNSSFITNYDTPSIREVFSSMVVHPSFGLHWDGVPAPTMTNSNAMDGVNAFITTNGWNMQTNNCAVDCLFNSPVFQNIRGLPWTVIHDREFPAVTHNHVLYVMFTGWHHIANGVAYNPLTNTFSGEIQGFKPIGRHWYIWGTSDGPVDLERIYEGQNKLDTNKSSISSDRTPPK